MATISCSPVTCVGTKANAFYFQVAAEDVDEDAFGISKKSLKNYYVRSKDNKFLLLNAENQFQAQNLTVDQLCDPDCKFIIQKYNNLETPGGKPVNATMLYMKVNDKNMVACCSHQGDIYPEEMEALPSSIKESSHKALFYMRTQSPSNTYTFESSMYPSAFLGFQSDGENPSLLKLVLQVKGKDEVDDSCDVILISNE